LSRAILQRWQKQLFPSEDFKREKGIVEREVWSAATMLELDDAYTRKVEGFKTVEEFYKWGSCLQYIHNIKVQ